ncbi:hypothetical protein QBC34DRAFT_188154 [Podospora aff. communis PSN243]|uniref:Dockerin type 1 n=1 Tax=Podospora aff. communis PSN243 TaxID=3040156 RepID=A0AAV9G7K4_9PEZI|nr:hypothetical protein QBC34DRAFT_188154 [Podospora aff. communis PSN243]
MLSDPTTTVLGADPSHRRCSLNGNAFQQDVMTSFRGWQYAAFYSFLDGVPEPLYIHLARRQLPKGPWEVIVLDNYPQTVDDGHNTVQLGICAGDGTIHLSFDHHCDILRYRVSVPRVALDPPAFQWTSGLFLPTQSNLPRYSGSRAALQYVTYPRFIPINTTGGLLFTVRDGKAGLGNDHLFRYARSEEEYKYTYIGQYITGIWSNPYIHGLNYRNGKLHVTWVWRGWVEYEGWDDPADVKHKMQAGPNGPENNHDLCYAWSTDLGNTWKNTAGATIANVGSQETISNHSPVVTVFEISKGCGLTNQEAQAVDHAGGVHVLNRDNVDGELVWRHYYRDPSTGVWAKRAVCPVPGPSRGRLAISKIGDLYLILPDGEKREVKIVKSAKIDEYSRYEEVWAGNGLTGEPLVDTARLDEDDVLSVFLIADIQGEEMAKNVVVSDFEL